MAMTDQPKYTGGLYVGDESTRQRAEAWDTVVHVLDRLAPGWLDDATNGTEAACAAMQKLLTQNTQDAELRAMCDGSYVSPEDEAQNTQGDGGPVAWMCETVNGYVAFSRDGKFPCNVGKVSPLYLHAERARVPDAMSTDGLNIMSSEFDRREGWNACREAMLAAAAPSQPEENL